MPVLSTFYGIVVSMYFMDNRRHHRPHVHARYQDDEAVLSIPEGELLEGVCRPENCDWFRRGLKSTETN